MEEMAKSAATPQIRDQCLKLAQAWRDLARSTKELQKRATK